VINLVRSVSITLAVSLAIAGAFLLINFNFWATFFVATLTQFVLFFIIGSVIEFFNELKMKEINLLKLSELSKQGLEVECPCFKKVKEFVPINLNGPSTYKCTECKKNVSVYITAETAYVSDPTIPELKLDV